MKVTHKRFAVFVPQEITIRIDTEQELVSLRAFFAGLSLASIRDTIDVSDTPDALVEPARACTKELYDHLNKLQEEQSK